MSSRVHNETDGIQKRAKGPRPSAVYTPGINMHIEYTVEHPAGSNVSVIHYLNTVSIYEEQSLLNYFPCML